MNKHVAVLLAFIFYSLALFSQQGTISGCVVDSVEDISVSYASVRLLSKIDSTYIKGGSTDDKGRFRLTANPQDYLLEVSFLGYKTHWQSLSLTHTKPNLDLGNIYLTRDSILLEEAVVVAKVPDIVVRGDTIEYNADAYIAQENDLLQDIIKKLPGIEIDADGNLMANGKPINKILVDGKEFFDNDIQMALKNLPANMVKKLQLFKEESETSKVTGFKDGKEEQVLNLTIKEDFKESLFGDFRIGYGNNDKYSNRVMANYMHGDNQLSLIGNMNNVNGDLDYGGRFFSPYAGIDKNKDIGLNFSSQKSKELRIGGNIRYSDNSNIIESRSNTESFLPTENQLNTQDSYTQNDRKSFTLGTNIEWRPDSLTTMYFRVSGGYNRNESLRESQEETFRIKGDTIQPTAEGWSNSFNKNDGYNVNGSLVIGRRLNSKGRNISINLTGNFRHEDGDGNNHSFTEYTTGEPNRIIDQLNVSNNKSNNWGVTLSYVEPVTEKNSIMVSYSYRYNKSNNTRDTYIADENGSYTILDKDYTRTTDNEGTSQTINVSFQSLQEKYEYSVGFNIDPSNTTREVSYLDSIIDNPKQKVVNYSPTLRLTYKPKENTSFSMDYRGSTSYPGISQLVADTVFPSATSKIYGNPNLKPSYNNNLNMYFMKSDYESGRFIMVSSGTNYIFNQIVNYTIIDNSGNSSTTYRNVDGNWSANGGVSFNTPFRNKKFTFSTNSYVYYSRYIGFSNEQKTVTNSFNINENATLNFRSDKFETRLQAGYSFNLTKNNMENQSNQVTSNISLSNNSTLKLPYDITLQNEISYSYNSGYSSDFKKNEVLWNAAISKQFLRKKMGTLKFQCFDILKDRNSVMRTVTGNYISDVRTNTVSRYFLVSFTYRFNVNRAGRGSKNDG